MYITLEEDKPMDKEEGCSPGSAGYDGAVKPAQPNRFRINWYGFRYGYRVSIPNYEGGEVITAEAYDALREAADAALKYIEAGPYLTAHGVELAERLRAALALVDGPLNQETK